MSASLAERIERKQAARIAKMASSQVRALAYFTAKGDEARAQAAADWLRQHARCLRCGRAISAEESVASGFGSECIKRVA